MTAENLNVHIPETDFKDYEKHRDLSVSFFEMKSEQFNPDKRIGIGEVSKLNETDYIRIFSGIDNYQFSGNHDFKNDEKLDAILASFIPKKWPELSVSEKKECIQQLSDYICDKIAIENEPEISFIYEDNSVYGGFICLFNKLAINKKFLNDPFELIDTIAHELRHAYQFAKAINPETKLDEMYAYNFENYIRPEDDYLGYRTQLVESEARSFAEQFNNEFSKVIGGEN